jgi:hypothetical protein
VHLGTVRAALAHFGRLNGNADAKHEAA